MSVNKFLLFIAITLFIFSCNTMDEQDTKVEWKYLTSIKAGQNIGVGIKYVDYEPDSVLYFYYHALNEGIRYLDLDGDGNNDFEFSHFIADPGIQSRRIYSLSIKPLGSNEICISKIKSNWVDSLKYNAEIDNTCHWSDSTALLYDYHWQMFTSPTFYSIEKIKGYWYNNDNIYIGVKIVKDTKPYYGWIDMYQNTIRQYAITMPYH